MKQEKYGKITKNSKELYGFLLPVRFREMEMMHHGIYAFNSWMHRKCLSNYDGAIFRKSGISLLETASQRLLTRI